MDTKTKRILLFIFGCILTRLLMVVVVAKSKLDYYPYYGAIAIIPAIAWLYLYFFNKRKTGPEVFGDKIWWDNLRPVHAFLYLMFAYSAITKKKNAYVYLLIDVIFGLFAFVVYHTSTEESTV